MPAKCLHVSARVAESKTSRLSKIMRRISFGKPARLNFFFALDLRPVTAGGCDKMDVVLSIWIR